MFGYLAPLDCTAAGKPADKHLEEFSCFQGVRILAG